MVALKKSTRKTIASHRGKDVDLDAQRAQRLGDLRIDQLHLGAGANQHNLCVRESKFQ